MKTFPIKTAIFLCCVLLFSFGAGKSSIEFKGDENFYFESSRYMLETGDTITPRYMNEERFQKPILFYWLILFAFKAVGVNWLAARLPSIILGSFCALLVFGIAELLFGNRKAAAISSLFFATTPLCYRYARLAVPDMALIFFETLALYFFLRYYRDKLRAYVIALFAALAAAFMIKGPVGALIPLLIIAIFLGHRKIYNRRLSSVLPGSHRQCPFPESPQGTGGKFRSQTSFLALKKERLFRFSDILAGMIVFAIITVPWFYVMCKMYPDRYASGVFGREIAQRIGWGGSYCFLLSYFKGFLFYLSALITKFFPYSLLMPFAFVGRAVSYSKRGKDGHIFLAVWALTVFLFFTLIAERRTHYLLALAPAVSILTAILFAPLEINSYKTRRLPKGNLSLTGFAKPTGGLKVPLGIVAALSVIYITISIFPPLGLFTNKMERAALAIKANIKEGDKVGIGSHGIIPEELQVFFKEPVYNVPATYTAEGLPSEDTALRLRKFLNSPEPFFCVIKKKDYETFIPEEMREKLYIVDKYFTWKRRIKFDKELKELLSKGLFREIFQNEIYVVTNRNGQ